MKLQYALGLFVPVFFGLSTYAQTPTPAAPTIPPAPALCQAANALDVAGVKAALAAGAVPDTSCAPQSGSVLSPLYEAAMQANSARRSAADQIGEMLAASGSSPDFVNSKRGSWGRRSLISNFALAARSSLTRTVQAYLARGANPNTAVGSSTILGTAASVMADDSSARIATVEALLRAGADPYLGNQGLLEIALSHSYPQEWLIALIGSWDFAKSKPALSFAMGEAVAGQNPVAVVKALQARGGDLNDAKLDSRSGYTTALEVLLGARKLDETQGAHETFDFYMAGTKNVNADDGLALRIAAQGQPTWVVTKLLKSGANPNVGQSSQNEAPPMVLTVEYADYYRTPEETVARLQLLLQSGAQIDQVDGEGRTALNVIAGYCMQSTAIEASLLVHGAHVNHRDSSGHTPACEAHLNGCQVVENYLESHGGVIGTCHW